MWTRLAKERGLGLKQQNEGAEFKLLAERKMGELLLAMRKRNDRKINLRRGAEVTTVTSGNSSLKELGISRVQSSRWQQLAEPPMSKFEQVLEMLRKAEQDLTTSASRRALVHGLF